MAHDGLKIIELRPPLEHGAGAVRGGNDLRGIARAVLGWKPTRDHLPTIVSDALGWERKLMLRNR